MLYVRNEELFSGYVNGGNVLFLLLLLKAKQPAKRDGVLFSSRQLLMLHLSQIFHKSQFSHSYF